VFEAPAPQAMTVHPRANQTVGEAGGNARHISQATGMSAWP